MKDSKISWTHHTFNLAWGCDEVSPECANCYARVFSQRLGKNLWGKEKPREVLSHSYWKQPLKWDREARKAGERHRVFCSSMADVFEDHPTITWQRQRLWEMIRQTQNLDWLLLTKRAERIEGSLPADWGQGYANVWLGVTVGHPISIPRANPPATDTCGGPVPLGRASTRSSAWSVPGRDRLGDCGWGDSAGRQAPGDAARVGQGSPRSLSGARGGVLLQTVLPSIPGPRKT